MIKIYIININFFKTFYILTINNIYNIKKKLLK